MYDVQFLDATQDLTWNMEIHCVRANRTVNGVEDSQCKYKTIATNINWCDIYFILHVYVVNVKL